VAIADYQVNSVIQTYIKNMKIKVGKKHINTPDNQEDEMDISTEATKKVLYDRIVERMTDKLKNHVIDQ
jgi:hypothetical protein